MKPVAPSEREPILDALRGVAVLGILLVNIEVMRGSEWLVLMAGGAADVPDVSDALVQFAVGWLATGKFISSLAILFGVGAALIVSRSLGAGQSPRALLARRYMSLMVFGAAHMLLFPGDILFLYGLTGLALLGFVTLHARTVLFWSAAILGVFSALGLRYLARPAPAALSEESAEPGFGSFDTQMRELRDQAASAYTEGSLGDIVSAHVAQSLLLQGTQLLVLPWVLALFLFGFAIARAGLFSDLAAHCTLLRRGALIGLILGVPANVGLGFYGALAGFAVPSDAQPVWITRWADFGQILGAPLLAVGYLCALSLLFLHRGATKPLAAVGRMALSAYLLQSAFALAVFGGLRLYDRLSSTLALLVVAGIWALLLIACPLWLRVFRLGPAEWLWRSLTYGQAQVMRNEPLKARI